MVYSLIEDIMSHWKLWVLATQSLFRLAWDPIDYQQTDPFIGNNFIFSNILYNWENMSCRINEMFFLPTAFQYWSQHGITMKFLAKF